MDVLAGCFDPDNPALTLQLDPDAPKPKGALSVVGGKLRYVPTPGFSGVDYLPFKVTDGVKTSRSRVYATVRSVALTPELPVATAIYAVGFSASGLTTKASLAQALQDAAGDCVHIFLNDSATAYTKIAATQARGSAGKIVVRPRNALQGAKIAGIGASASMWGSGRDLTFYGIDWADDFLGIGGDNVDFLRCLWSGWRGNPSGGDPQMKSEASFTRIGYSEVKDCNNNFFNLNTQKSALRPVIAFSWMHGFRPAVDNGGEMFRYGTGNEDRNDSLKGFVHGLLLEDHVPTAGPGGDIENETIGNKCCDNIYQLVRAKNVRGVNNRHGLNTIFNGVWLSGSQTKMQINHKHVRLIGLKMDSGTAIQFNCGNVDADQWARTGKPTGGGSGYPQCSDCEIRDSDLNSCVIGKTFTGRTLKVLNLRHQNSTGVVLGGGAGNASTASTGLGAGITTLTCPDWVGDAKGDAGVGIGSDWRGWPTRSYT